MRNIQVFALVAVLAVSFGSIKVCASNNADVYNFIANEQAKIKSAAVALVQGRGLLNNDTAAKSAHQPNQVGKSVNAKRSRLSRKKPAGKMNKNIAPAHLAAHDIEAYTRPVSGRKPLGYDPALRNRYRDLVAKYTAENDIPFALGDAVMRVESRYRQESINGGAVGLMQIKPATARDLGYRGTVKGLMHPETNIKYGMKYLGQAYRLAKGETCGTVMRYQSGHYAKRINRANLAYCANVRTIVASLGSEVAMTSQVTKK